MPTDLVPIGQIPGPFTLPKLNTELRKLWTQINALLGRNSQPEILDDLTVRGALTAGSIDADSARIGEKSVSPTTISLDPATSLPETPLIVSNGVGARSDIMGPIDPFIVSVKDDFFSLTSTSGSVGELGWTIVAGSATGTVATTIGHPGIVVQSSGAGPAVGAIRIGGFSVLDLGYMSWVVSPQSVTASAFSFGLTIGNPLGGVGVNQGIFHIFRSGTSPNWETQTRDALGVTTITSTIPVVAGNWYLLEQIYTVGTSSQTIDFYINRQRVSRHTTNIPTGSNTPIVSVAQTTDGTPKDVFLDQFIASGRVPLSTKRWS